MESLDLLWGMGCTLAVALIASDEVNSSHAGTAPGHSPG